MSVHIGEIVPFTQGGNGNMGDLENRYRPIGRAALSAPRFVLVYYRVLFSASNDDATTPTLNADLEFRIDHRARHGSIGGDGAGGSPGEGIRFSFLITKSANMGFGGTLDKHYRLTDDELQAGTMFRGDAVVALWTNPHADSRLHWDLEFGLAPLT